MKSEAEEEPTPKNLQKIIDEGYVPLLGNYNLKEKVFGYEIYYQEDKKLLLYSPSEDKIKMIIDIDEMKKPGIPQNI